MSKKTKARRQPRRTPQTDAEHAERFAESMGSPFAPPPQPPPADRPVPTELITGEDLRNSSSYLAEIWTRPGKLWRLRKVEAFDLFMKGIISAPLMATVQKLDTMRTTLKANPKAFETISEADKREVMTVLREYAKAVVVAPRIIDKDDGDPQSVPIDLLEFWDLMALMQATPVRDTLPRLSGVDAENFRGAATRVDGDAASNGQGLRGSAERIPDHTRPAVERA